MVSEEEMTLGAKCSTITDFVVVEFCVDTQVMMGGHVLKNQVKKGYYHASINLWEKY